MSALPVVYVTGKDPREDSGSGHSTYVRAHARAATAAGFEPHLFCVGRGRATYATEYGVVHRLPNGLMRFNELPGTGVSSWMAPFVEKPLADAVDDFLGRTPAARLIHAFGLWGSAAVRAARRNPAAVAILSSYVTIRSEYQGRRDGWPAGADLPTRLRFAAEEFVVRTLAGPREVRAYEEARLVLVNYDSVRRLVEAEARRPVAFRKIAYAAESAFGPTPTGPEPAALSQLRPADAPLVVAVSRHDSRKGLAVLLEALARLRTKGAVFRACLVGGGPLLDAHRRLTHTLELADSVVLSGHVPDVGPYLSRADVFVLPSLAEGSGSVSLLEAMQFGKPAVVSAVDGLPEDVTDSVNGLLTPPGDAQSLAAALGRMLADSALRDRIGAAARRTFEERFSAAALSADLKRLYDEMLGESHAHRAA